ncbi:hypothetical protein M011DRAFT_45995 [Sporormia fimetaria CBS 119925]|uniref:Uncharacterized protein n=1 Tax=Sporormia fimetaria CBS 119925 TaxID=1340428 RepID=A0A6A6VEB1_9PLEO|nr:hypothetical protein M011DRAFT_45995 [Sporormia fimetaria CBS 119925]
MWCGENVARRGCVCMIGEAGGGGRGVRNLHTVGERREMSAFRCVSGWLVEAWALIQEAAAPPIPVPAVSRCHTLPHTVSIAPHTPLHHTPLSLPLPLVLCVADAVVSQSFTPICLRAAKTVVRPLLICARETRQRFSLPVVALTTPCLLSTTTNKASTLTGTPRQVSCRRCLIAHHQLVPLPQQSAHPFQKQLAETP